VADRDQKQPAVKWPFQKGTPLTQGATRASAATILGATDSPPWG